MCNYYYLLFLIIIYLLLLLLLFAVSTKVKIIIKNKRLKQF